MHMIFIPDVVKKGAAAVVVEKDVTPIEGVTYIKVDNTRLALACMTALILIIRPRK